MRKKQKLNKKEQFLVNCSKAKGFEVLENLEPCESITEHLINQPCLYPSLIEYIGEQSSAGKLNLEEVQDEIPPEVIESLIEVIGKALKQKV